MSRKRTTQNKSILPLIMMIIGAIIIFWWMPVWIWLVIIGAILVIVGIDIY